MRGTSQRDQPRVKFRSNKHTADSTLSEGKKRRARARVRFIL